MTMLRRHHGTTLIILALLFFSIDLWGKINGAYHTTYWIDILTHFVFGVWLTLFLFYPTLWKDLTPLTIFVVVTLVGLGWETTELARDTFYAGPRGIPLAQHGLDDSLKDMLVNTVAAASTLWAFRKNGHI